MILGGLSTFVWFIDIVISLVQRDFRISNSVCPTKPTALLDIGIIAPLAFLCAGLLHKKKLLGYVLASALLMLNGMIGITVIGQTLAQYALGLSSKISELIAYVVPFLSLSFIAFFFLTLFCRKLSKMTDEKIHRI